jgi:hypothetical protein
MNAPWSQVFPEFGGFSRFGVSPGAFPVFDLIGQLAYH